ncbi:hypothetical protein NIT60_09485 [Mammaliicoccus sciuri]|nr:hypothetical protein NIT60_09485 [Mammaliicoccus sciuri]
MIVELALYMFVELALCMIEQALGSFVVELELQLVLVFVELALVVLQAL